MIDRLFLDHPRSVGETYFEHQRVALGFALAMIAGGLACLVHALVPGLFTTRGSRTIAELHRRMVVARVRRPDQAAAAARDSWAA